jgi:DNA polymerase elongation subunit (family B)
VTTARILLLDIETAPNRAYVWGLWDQNISHEHLEESSYVLCWSAKWLDDKTVRFKSRQRSEAKAMLAPVHSLLSEADAVVHYNGLKFDIPVLQKEFLKHGFQPPAPFKQIDLMLAVKRAFRFESNKLDYVAGALGLGSKVRHSGFDMWVKCMNGDAAAWREMETYNRGDVVLLEKLYRRLLPWLEKHPNMSTLGGGGECCPKCGSKNVHKRGTALAVTRKYTRYQCQACGGWFRSTRSVHGAATTLIGA